MSSAIGLRCPVAYKKIPAKMYNAFNKIDGVTLLKMIKTNSIPLVFFDPQYRNVLDHLSYGNEGRRQKRRALFTQMSKEKTLEMGIEIARILKPSGYCMMWCDKYDVLNFDSINIFGYDQTDEPYMQTVDMITWNKMTGPGMGLRTRRIAEYLVILQKPPIRVKGTWSDHNIIDCWSEKIYNSNHPHAKPDILQRRLIEATTKPNNIVVDPTAGSFAVLHACRLTNRRFLGTDLIGDRLVTAKLI